MSALAAMRSDKARLVKAATSPGKKKVAGLARQPAGAGCSNARHSPDSRSSPAHNGTPRPLLLQEKPPSDDSESDAPHKDPSLIQRVEEEVRHEIDEASRRKVASAEARIVAYSDSDSEEELPFKRGSRRTAAGGTEQPDSRHSPSPGCRCTAGGVPTCSSAGGQSCKPLVHQGASCTSSS